MNLFLPWLIEKVIFAHVFVSGWGSATYSRRTKKDPWGTHEATAGEAETTERGTEDDIGEGQVPTSPLLHSQSYRVTLVLSSLFFW